MNNLMNKKISSCTLCFFVIFAYLLFLMTQVQQSTGFIILGNTTACDTCDEYQTYSGR